MARGQQTEKKKKPIKYFDYSLLFLIIFLLCFGLVMLYSTSSYAGSNKFGDASYFVKRQLFATGLGIVGMYIVSKIPYRFWMKVSSMAYLAAIVLCTAVIFIGTEANGQARWLKIGPLSFQPSEFAKFAVIIFLATVIYKTPQKMGEFMSLVKIMAIVLPIVAVVAYNNLSTAIIVFGISAVIFFVAYPRTRKIGIVFVCLVVGGLIAGQILGRLLESSGTSVYRESSPGWTRKNTPKAELSRQCRDFWQSEAADFSERDWGAALRRW